MSILRSVFLLCHTYEPLFQAERGEGGRREAAVGEGGIGQGEAGEEIAAAGEGLRLEPTVTSWRSDWLRFLATIWRITRQSS